MLKWLFDSLRKTKKTVAEINILEPEIAKLNDSQLLTESERLKKEIQSGADLDRLLPRSFALAREAAKRTLKQRHFDVQLMGGVVLHQGGIVEMATGEGKTLASTAPIYLNALTGRGVHVVTVNEYLAKRDAVWMGQIYHALGLKVACLVHEGAFLYDPNITHGHRGLNADSADNNNITRGHRGLNADSADNNNKLLYEDLTYKIRSVLFIARKAVGLGHKENVYQNVIEQELQKIGLKFEKEKAIDVIHDGKKVGIYRPDFVVENKVILEIKSLPFIGKVEENQIQTYLRGSQYKVGLLVNFGGKDIEIKRVVYDKARDLESGPRESALGPRESALGPRESALGPRESALGPRESALGPRESALGPRESALLDKERDTTGSFLVQEEYLRSISRKEAYLADITYGTNHEFGFDYLRDNLAHKLEDQVQFRVNPRTNQRESAHSFAVIDEVDSVLIDEARTPLIISVPDAESSNYYKVFSRIAAGLNPGEDYLIDEKLRSADITQEGIDKIERLLNIKNIFAPEYLRLTHYLQESLRAYGLFKKDKDYVVKNGQIIIVDQFTGRLMPGRRYSGGLHQALEAKEGILVQQESRTYAQITIQNYFRMYEKLAGMTGTAITSAEEFDKVYGLKVVSIPTNKPMIRKNLPDLIYKTEEAKFDALIADIKERQKKGQPVLVGTVSIAKNEVLHNLLTQAGIRHEILNAKNHEREGQIIAQAGKPGAVTIATNMAGRGVDIVLGGNPPDIVESEKVKGLGGLHVIGTERHEARRIDNQLRGRSGRQGDPGSSQFYLSLEDDLMRIFGGERIKNLMETLKVPDDMPIEAGMVSKALSQAQSRVEGFNFDARKHLLDYDDVLNKQRTAIYKKRQELLKSGVHPQVLSVLDLFWMNHLEAMDAFRESVRLRAYAQHDPLVEYKREGHILYQQMLEGFEKWVEENREKLRQISNIRTSDVPRTSDVQKLGVTGKIGRNDPCPCGARHEDGRPMKYKYCHGKNV